MSDAAITEYYVDRVRGPRVPLSQRIRPDCEAAPWVVEEVRTMEAELSEARAAIAELIEAAQFALDKAWEYGEEEPHFVKLNVAIARCNGGAE